MLRKLTSIEDVVSELGGVEATLRLTERQGSSVIPVWKHRGHFPSYTYPAIQKALSKKGAVAPDSLWVLKRKRSKANA